jgi:hypothetical protein
MPRRPGAREYAPGNNKSVDVVSICREMYAGIASFIAEELTIIRRRHLAAFTLRLQTVLKNACMSRLDIADAFGSVSSAPMAMMHAPPPPTATKEAPSATKEAAKLLNELTQEGEGFFAENRSRVSVATDIANMDDVEDARSDASSDSGESVASHVTNKSALSMRSKKRGGA